MRSVYLGFEPGEDFGLVLVAGADFADEVAGGIGGGVGVEGADKTAWPVCVLYWRSSAFVGGQVRVLAADERRRTPTRETAI